MDYENYDPYFPDQPVVDLYLPIWASQPSFRSKPAFVWAEDGSQRASITYGQLNSWANSMASELLIPLKRGDVVLILCSPGLQLIKVLFACQRAGLLSIPIFPNDPSLSSASDQQHHLTRVLLQTKPKAAIADSRYITTIRRCFTSSADKTRLSQLLQQLKWLSVDDFEGGDDHTSSLGSPYSGCKPDEVYLIQYTSGATGIPKPVLVTIGAATHNVRMARKAYDLHPNSVIVSWLPQYHDCGLMFLLLTIISGATCVLTSPTTFVNRPRLWLELISEFQATCTPVPSFALPLVIKRGGINKGSVPMKLESLKNLILINEPIYRAPVEEFVAEFAPFGLNPSSISPSYGLAENCTFVSTAWRSSGDFGTSFPNIPSYNQLLPSARLGSLSSNKGEVEEIEIVVVNEQTCELVEDGVEGEIWISSPSNAVGYLSHPSLTREVFQGRLKGRVSSLFVRTGDRGIVRGEERYLFVTGRTTDVIKLGDGMELHPHYLEIAAYNSCPERLRGGCIAAFEFSKAIAIIAELQRGEGTVKAFNSICKGIREAIKKQEKIEIGLVVLVKSGSLPKTTSGKMQRWAAKEKLMRRELRPLSEIRFQDRGRKMPLKIHGKRESREDGKEREEFVTYWKTNSRLNLLSLL